MAQASIRELLVNGADPIAQGLVGAEPSLAPKAASARTSSHRAVSGLPRVDPERARGDVDVVIDRSP